MRGIEMAVKKKYAISFLVIALFIQFGALSAQDRCFDLLKPPAVFVEKAPVRRGPRGHRGHKGHSGKRGHHGHKGKKGHKGSTGALASNYISSYGLGAFSSASFPSFLFPFATNRAATGPVGITHPVLGDATAFQVTQTGQYLVTWTVQMSGIGVSASIALDLLLDGVVVPPGPTLQRTFMANTASGVNLAGSLLLHVNAGQILQLQGTSINLGLVFGARTFCIMQIAQ